MLGYEEVIFEPERAGARVAIVGAGGIGFDVATLLTAETEAEPSVEAFMAEWGIDPEYRRPGGLCEQRSSPPPRKVYLMQRKPGKLGRGLGKTTGWIHRQTLRRRGVEMLAGVTYEKIDARGIHIHDEEGRRVIEVDTVVICAGQEPLRELQEDLVERGLTTHLIGGAHESHELDAKVSIDQGTRLALQI